MFKNVASQYLECFAFADAGHASLDPGEPVTGDAANITGTIEQDSDGTHSATNDVNPTEIAAGFYRFTLTQAETNADKIFAKAASSTAGVQVVIVPSSTIYTRPQYFSDLGIESDGHAHADVKQWVGTTVTLSSTTSKPEVDVNSVSDDATAANNLELACDNYSATRGLSGTALPAAAADAAGGLIISDAGGLDLDNRLAAAASITRFDIAYGGDCAFADCYMGAYGPGIYYDDAAGNTNTTFGTDGTWSNPVSSLAAVVTLAANLQVKRVYITGNSTLTLTGQTLTGYVFVGAETISDATVNLGTAASASVLTRCKFIGLTIYGTHDLTDRIECFQCSINDAPAAEVTTLRAALYQCIFIGDFEIDTSTDNIFDFCSSGIAGNSTPVITCNGAAGSLMLRHYSGGVELKSLSASHTVSVETDGQVIFNADCNVNATVAIRGMATITDNTAGMNNLTQTATAQNLNDKIDTVDTVADTILVDTNELQTDWADGGRLDLLLDACSTLTVSDIALEANSGKAIYVETDGNDSNDGLSRANAKLTVAAAVSAASAYDTVFIGEGSFALSAALKWDTTLKIVGRGRDVTTLTGSATNYIKPGAYSEIHDLTCDQIAFKSGDTAWTHAKLYNVYCANVFDALFPSSLTTTCQLSAWNCEFSSSGGEGILLSGTTGLTVQLYDCVVTGANNAIRTSGGRIVMVGGFLRGTSSSGTGWIAATVQTAGNIDLIGVSVVDDHHSAVPTVQLSQTGSGTITVRDCAYDASKTSGTISIHPLHSMTSPGTITTLDALDTAQDTQHGTTQAAIAALNDVSQADITGGAYALDTDANGRVRIVDGTGVGELDTASGLIAGIAGTKSTLDDLNDLSAADLLDLTDGIESSVTLRQAIRAIAAATTGILSGAGTGTEVVKGIGQLSGGTTRATYTVDASGNRTAIALNL